MPDVQVLGEFEQAQHALPNKGGARDMVGDALERKAASQQRKIEREVVGAHERAYPERLHVTNTNSGLRPAERDAIGEALEAIGDLPPRLEATVTRELDRLSEFKTQMRTAQQAYDRAKDRVREIGKAVTRGQMPANQLKQAQRDAVLAKRTLRDAGDALRESDIRVSIDDISQRPKDAGAPPEM
ncbi:MAG: hypothetical protein IIC18_05005, partial [Bacteroidetes bacterium]|nr:hypothetical protein [Bacteroidota bacterium]